MVCAPVTSLRAFAVHVGPFRLPGVAVVHLSLKYWRIGVYFGSHVVASLVRLLLVMNAARLSTDFYEHTSIPGAKT